jgi:rod shape-determining protein MreD
MTRHLTRGGLAVLTAFLVFSALRQISLPLALGIDVFTVAVIVHGFFEGEIAGSIVGAVCGLVIDAFSHGLFGLSGLSKTVVGFLAGFISRKINVQLPARMAVFAGLLGAVDLGLGILLSTLVGAESLPWARGWLFIRPAGAAVLATAAVQVLRRIRSRHEG